jgi:hypothetical protein
VNQTVTLEIPQSDRVVALDSYRPPFRKVPTEEIGAAWPFVERGLVSILERCRGEAWTPRDIRRHIRQGRAGLFVRKDGFVVLERCEQPITHEPYLNVWLMWFEALALPKHEVAAWLDEMAKSLSCEWWQFSSPRMGWGQYLEGICEPAYQTWRRSV